MQVVILFMIECEAKCGIYSFMVALSLVDLYLQAHL